MKSIHFTSEKIVQDILQYGLVLRKSLILQFPKQLLNHEFVNIFCRGYFDGDGCWCWHASKTRPNRKPQLVFSLRGTLEFLSEFNDILVKQACLKVKQKKISKSGGIYQLTYVGNTICTKIAQWLYKDIDSSKTYRLLQRKFDIVQDMLGHGHTIILP